jgi:hypothetical protein
MPTYNDGESGADVRAKINAAITAVDALVKNNIAATSPTVNDDSGDGYAVGSRWFNTVAGAMFVCRSAAVGAAVWIRQDMADFFGYQAGKYYHGIIGTMAAGATIAANSVRFHPTIIKERVTISELGTRVTTAESAKNIQLGIYASDPVTKLPTGVPLGTTASLLTTSSGVISGAITPVTLEPGLYWMAAIADVTTAVFQQYGGANNSISLILGAAITQIAPGNSASIAFLSYTHAFGTWPDVTAGGFSYGQNSAFVGVFFRVAP